MLAQVLAFASVSESGPLHGVFARTVFLNPGPACPAKPAPHPPDLSLPGCTDRATHPTKSLRDP